MIQLNLVPPKVRAAELLRKILFVGALLYVAAAGWLGWQWSLGHMQLLEARKATQKVQDELNAPELQVAVRAVQKFADDMAAVKAKASLVNEFRKQQVPLMRLLDAVPDWTMNGQVWFSSLDAEAGHGGRAVTLVGSTLSRALFVRFYDFMSSQAVVKGLSLDGEPTEVDVRDMQTVQFKLGFTVEDQP